MFSGAPIATLSRGTVKGLGMDTKNSKPMCWEIIGCGRQDSCKVVAISKATGKPCWEAVRAFDDYRSALNVCNDCIVAVLNGKQSLSMNEIDEIMNSKGGGSSHHPCPGLSIS